MKKFFDEFKSFIAKGNVIDMATAVIIGAAFNKIVTSLVNDIIMPLIGLIVGKMNIADMKYVFSKAVLDDAGAVLVPENALRYGLFIQAIIDFLIIGFSIFCALKVVLAFQSKFNKKEEEIAEEAPADPEPTEDQKLLAEIRDLLKAQNTKVE